MCVYVLQICELNCDGFTYSLLMPYARACTGPKPSMLSLALFLTLKWQTRASRFVLHILFMVSSLDDDSYLSIFIVGAALVVVFAIAVVG